MRRAHPPHDPASGDAGPLDHADRQLVPRLAVLRSELEVAAS